MKKVLIITYHFPPSAGAATQRILKFLKFLPKFGWEPHILTVDKVDYPDQDLSLMEKIPDSVKIFRTKFLTPFGIYRKITGRRPEDKIPVASIKKDHKSFAERLSVFLRMNIFIPDAKIGWIPYGVKEGARLVKEEGFEMIISSGPPHTCHLIARNIKRKTGVKWVADFRDPWTDIDYYSGISRTKIAQNLDTYLEFSVLSEANAVVSASAGYLEILKSKGARNRYEVITNGYDQDDFQGVEITKENKFIVTYTGNMPKTRNPKSLWIALNELLKNNMDFSRDFEFRFAGVIDEEVKSEILNTFPFSDYFKNYGYLNHQKAIELVFNSDLLIMIVNQVNTSKEILPGKIFEYIATGNKILVIGPENGQSGIVINEVNQGIALDYDKIDMMKDFIEDTYKEWKNGSLKKKEGVSNSTYSRETIAGNLVKIMNDL